MGQDVSVILNHDAGGRRSPPTAVANEARFAFCETWDAKSVDHLLTTYTSQYQSLHSSELHTQDDRRRALESEILELEAHLLTLVHEAGDDCDNSGLRANLESKRRQLYAYSQMPSRDAIDYALPLHWSVYMAAAKHVETEATFGALRRKRAHWHVATDGYEMEKDPTAAAELARMEIERLKFAAPAPNHEIDGHTDDNASESEKDSLDGGDSDLDDNDIQDNDSKPKAPTTDSAPTPVLTQAVLDELRAPPPPSPLFDPSLRSPVFFGYTTAPMLSPVDATKVSEQALADRERTYFELRIARAKKRIDDATAIERGKLKSLLERRDAALEKRQKVHAARAREMDEAKQEGLDPTADFFRKMELSGEVLAADEAKDDAVFASQEASILGRMATASATGEDEIALLQALQFGRSPPIAPRRRKFHEAELAELTRSLGQARMDLENSAKTLEETKARLEAPAPDSGAPSGINPNNARTQLLFATDQVIAAEKLIANLAARVNEEEFMLQRADVVRDLEALYLPSFALLEGLPTDCGDPKLLRMELLLLFHARAASLTAKLKYTYASYVDAASGRLQRPGLTRLLQSLFQLLQALGELHLKPSVDDSFWANVAARACPPQGLTWRDFKRFSKDEVERSQLLARFFRVPWRLSGWSRLQTQTIAPLHQFELGAISLSDLKFTLAKQHLRPRMALVPHRMEILHIRALAMGANDPLKADYSKYLKSRKTKVLSNVVPLDHGAYRNLLVYRQDVATRAAVRLQTSWRAKKGRHDAYMAAKKQAFYHAKGTALLEARAAAEAEWHKLESTKDMSLEKMKFDAKIRMRQVKLRTKGLTMDRRQVLCVMVEEAVQDALEEVDHRFREMEEDAGYVPVQLRFDPLNLEHFAEISSALIDQLKRARLPTLETATLLKRIAEKSKEDVPETTTPVEAPGPPPTFRSSAVEPKHFVPEASLRSKQAQMAARHIAMMRGVNASFAECSSIEKRVWLALASSTPELDDWSDRLQYVCDGLTDFKLRELLLELPSKRHAIEYVLAFRKHLIGSNQSDELTFDREALVADLMGHFRILRGVDDLADSLMYMASSDVESTLRDATATTLQSQEIYLAKHVAKAQLKAASVAAKARQRRANGRDLVQRLEFERKNQAAAVAAAKANADEALQKWKHAQLSLDLLQTQLQAANIDEQSPKTRPTSLDDRTCWAERLKRSLTDASSDAWVEMFHVCQDFVQVASHIAVQIAREHYLPVHAKSMLPLATTLPFQMDGRNDGVVRSSLGKGLRFEAHNIRFQVAVDDHGRYEGADELAMKAAGAEVRNSALYLPTLLSCPNVLAPLVCTVDYCGLRVLCVAKLPIERYEINDRGAITNISTEFVYGTNNKGRTVTYHSKSLDGAVRKANAALNLTAHGVRGTQDLTAKMLSGAGDMHGYLGRDEWLCLLRFRRSMPPEDPDLTRHLPSSTRGMSILWRQLRPTLVQTQPLPLSSDALSFLTNQTPDWETHVERVTAATAHLLDDVIPAFARKLATRPMYVDAPGFDLVAELHRHGINVRHLGYLRAQFRYQLSGSVAMTFNSNVVTTTQDMTREVQRGDVVYIHGDTYTISTSRNDEVSTTTLTLDRPYPHDSTQNVTVATGAILDPTQQLRERLLVEMLQRTIKNLLRFALRQQLQSRQLAMGPNHAQLVLTYLNFLSGVGDGAHAFWDIHVFDGVRSRFGPIAVSYVERLNLRRAPVAIAKYLCQCLGIDLTSDCWAHFTASPHGFVFTADDLVLTSTGRIKHNMSLLHYAAASLLLDRASLVQGTTYQAGVLTDAPVGYWPLAERRGAKVARNLGSSSDHGKFSPSCILEASGPIANDDLCRAVTFPYATHAYIGCQRTQRWESTVTLEAWACPTKDGSGIRAILSHGRCTLAVLKNHRWGAWVNLRNIDVVVTGGLVAYGEWTHVACTFDGATLLLFVGGVLHGDLDVVSEVDLQLQRRDAKFAALRANLEAQEEAAKTDCFKAVERESRVYFSSKEGKKFIAELAKKVRDEAEFKERLNKKASQRKLETETTAKVKPATKPDYEILAKQQHTTANYHAKVDAIMDAFKKLRVDLNAKIDNEIAEELSKESRPCRIGCVANASSNGKYFVGSLAHVAYYTKPLSRDTLYRHYLLGSVDRAITSDRLFELSAARFTKALAYTPEEPSFLAAYAINICSSLKYDLDQRRSQEMYKAKVRRALDAFRLRENYKGCAEILKYLPRDVRFSDLFREAYRCVTELCPSYWTPDPTSIKTLSLLDLASLPVQYFLSGNPAQSSLHGLLTDEVAAYADIICRVVSVYATHYGDGLTDLKWLCDLETPSVVVYFVLWLQAGEDGRRFDLSSVPTVTCKDMDVITSANRSCLALNLAKCMALNDKTICMIAVRCSGLEALDVSGLSHLTDVSVLALAKSCRNLKALHANACGLLTDAGIEALAACMDLRELCLANCGKLTDDSLRAIGLAHPRLTRLELSFCIQLSDFEGFARVSNALNLSILDVSGCRRLKDIGLSALCRKFTKLTSLNLAYCDKITDVGLWAATHNCLELATLNLQELVLLTDKAFTFDHEGDGRANVAKSLLQHMQTIVLADCKGLSDTAIAYLHHRARSLVSLDVSGCLLATDQMLKYTTFDIFNGTDVGSHLRVLDLSFCMQLSSEGLRYIRDRCKHLVTLFLTGCVCVNDDAIIALLRACPRLSRLGLGYCRDVTDAVLFAIADTLWVQVLSLTRCGKITDAGVTALATQCNGLAALTVASCKRLTDASMAALLEHCPKLLELDVAYCPHITSNALAPFVSTRLGMVLRSDCPLSAPPALIDDVLQERLFREASKKLQLPPLALHTPRRLPTPRTARSESDDAPTMPHNNDDEAEDA
ncbi:hypothetical protein SDRG_14482 [Saprolegnia diclina VS20]|uniref:Clu domain-containing protein n=1 Tax=Saprolegnia diclina (strain VS20) TaxID=1156394 RepID=T0PZQ0_SAPDV|nr:hypothetical protein SDRG_14482 [Saprolegnia diclina VS20]EQC27731.1 hypothetical protein SDRG_14482 [Saprolegnia diclina VS20]|eukprot:XP_008618836.1 hypothetical protein SDRG_14482 [Saprolegnia diclina VS20]